jgi:hypothetical protein
MSGAGNVDSLSTAMHILTARMVVELVFSAKGIGEGTTGGWLSLLDSCVLSCFCLLFLYALYTVLSDCSVLQF